MTHSFFEKKAVIFAHRGASKSFPENTLLAFTKAVEVEADVIETDVQYTQDNNFVCFHDDTLERTTNGKGRVFDFSLGELTQLDSAYNFSLDNGNTYPYRNQGIKMMSLDEVLSEFPAQRFNIDLKQKNPEQVKFFIDIIKKHNAVNRIIVASEHFGNLKEVRRICPEIGTSFSMPEVLWFYFLSKSSLIFLNFKFRGIALQVPENWGSYNIITKPFIVEAHKKNIKVHAWTINNKKDMQRLFEMGVDGIISDDPELVKQVYKNKLK